MTAKKCPTCHNVHGSFVPMRPKPAKRKAKKRSVTVWLYAWKWPIESDTFVRTFYTKREALHDRRGAIKDRHVCGPIVRVEVPL